MKKKLWLYAAIMCIACTLRMGIFAVHGVASSYETENETLPDVVSLETESEILPGVVSFEMESETLLDAVSIYETQSQALLSCRDRTDRDW